MSRSRIRVVMLLKNITNGIFYCIGHAQKSNDKGNIPFVPYIK